VADTHESLSIEFAEWWTPFQKGHVTILEVSYWSRAEDSDAKLRTGSLDKNLIIRLFNNEDETVYRVCFEHAGAYRQLDEHGLLELWHARELQDIPILSTFRVRNHGWSKESPLSFHMCATEGWSYVIATHSECVEVLTRSDPQVIVET
jgi:hypothetical protein